MEISIIFIHTHNCEGMCMHSSNETQCAIATAIVGIHQSFMSFIFLDDFQLTRVVTNGYLSYVS